LGAHWETGAGPWSAAEVDSDEVRLRAAASVKAGMRRVFIFERSWLIWLRCLGLRLASLFGKLSGEQCRYRVLPVFPINVTRPAHYFGPAAPHVLAAALKNLPGWDDSVPDTAEAQTARRARGEREAPGAKVRRRSAGF
jgi:hypothetical protein